MKYYYLPTIMMGTIVLYCFKSYLCNVGPKTQLSVIVMNKIFIFI